MNDELPGDSEVNENVGRIPGDTRGAVIELSIEKEGMRSLSCFGLGAPSFAVVGFAADCGGALIGTYVEALRSTHLIVIGIERHLGKEQNTLSNTANQSAKKIMAKGVI